MLGAFPSIPFGAERSFLTGVKVKLDMGVLLLLRAVVVRSSLDAGIQGTDHLASVRPAEAPGEGYLREWLRTLVCSSTGYLQMAPADKTGQKGL